MYLYPDRASAAVVEGGQQDSLYRKSSVAKLPGALDGGNMTKFQRAKYF